jgi:hypothetical protein
MNCMDGVRTDRRDVAKLGQKVNDAAGPDLITKFSQLRIDGEELSEVTQSEDRVLGKTFPRQF